MLVTAAKQLETLTSYLFDALGVELDAAPWQEVHLPHFLRQTYSFYIADLLETNALLIFDEAPARPSSILRKHMDLIGRRWDGAQIYVCPALSSYDRKRLIQEKIPFIVPGNQLYLPPLGIDLREHFRRLARSAEALSPASQVLLLHLMLNLDADNHLTASVAAKQLGYTAMTMGRAAKELAALELISITPKGTARNLQLSAPPRETWATALPVLSTPVSRRLCIAQSSNPPPGADAGLTALATRTMLAPPRRRTLALSRNGWTSFKREHTVVEVSAQEPEALEIEIWRYPPDLFARDAMVDPLSLYLSLQDDDDERTALALEELLETVTW